VPLEQDSGAVPDAGSPITFRTRLGIRLPPITTSALDREPQVQPSAKKAHWEMGSWVAGSTTARGAAVPDIAWCRMRSPVEPVSTWTWSMSSQAVVLPGVHTVTVA